MATFYAPAGYGAPMEGDVAYFYDGDTTTPAPVYQDLEMEDSLGTSVTADANGGFPAIFLDNDVLYKVKFIRAGGDVAYPLRSYYPINGPQAITDGSVTASMLAAGVAASNLGYTPVNRAGDSMTGELLLAATFTTRDQRAAGLTGAGVNNTQNGAYTFTLVDVRKVTQKTNTSTPTWTIPPQGTIAFVQNDLLPVENNGASGDVTIAPGAGVTLTPNGSGASGSQTLTPNTSAVLKNVGLNVWRLV